MKTLRILVSLVWSKIKTTLNLAVENIALRQQLAVMKRTNKRPNIRVTDRLFWVLLSRIWTGWRQSLVIVKPNTVVRWHRNGFKLFWKYKSKGPGRPRVSREIRDLVRKMAKANPSWGAPRIHGELLRLGFEVSERTVSNLMPRLSLSEIPSVATIMRPTDQIGEKYGANESFAQLSYTENYMHRYSQWVPGTPWRPAFPAITNC